MNDEIEKLTGEGLCECAECKRTKRVEQNMDELVL